MNRLTDLLRFYTLIDRLREHVRGTHTLNKIGLIRDWPRRGVYFFFEPEELRRESGVGPRVVRIGTHALTPGSQSTIRLRQHRGGAAGGGNHRASIFRLLVGNALLARGELPQCQPWGVKGDATKAAIKLGVTRNAMVLAELPVEQAVTSYLGAMPVLWLDVEDDPGPDSRRGFIERNAIALLSNLDKLPLDPPSTGWLGNFSDRSLVRESGLWNQRHVNEPYDPDFLPVLEATIERMGWAQ